MGVPFSPTLPRIRPKIDISQFCPAYAVIQGIADVENASKTCDAKGH